MFELLASNQNFFESNQQYFVFIAAVCAIIILVLGVLTLKNCLNLKRDLLINKLKVIDLFEKNTDDGSPFYTIVVTNNSINSVSIASIGFVHDGDFFNFKKEFVKQLTASHGDLIIPPRTSIKLRLYKEQLEGAVFKTVKHKELKKISVYIVGLSGETYSSKTKFIGKKMRENFKEYYMFNKPEIIKKFVASRKLKLDSGLKLGFFENMKYRSWSKIAGTDLPTIKTPNQTYEEFEAKHSFDQPEIVEQSQTVKAKEESKAENDEEILQETATTNDEQNTEEIAKAVVDDEDTVLIINADENKTETKDN